MTVDIQPDAGLGVPKATANGEHVNSGAYDGRHETRLEAASWRCESVPTPSLKIAGAHQLALHSAEYKRRRRDVAHTEREPDFEHLDFVSPKDGNRLGGEGDVTPPAFRLWRLEAQSRIRLFETALTWQRLSLCRPIAGPAVHPGAFLLQAQARRWERESSIRAWRARPPSARAIGLRFHFARPSAAPFLTAHCSTRRKTSGEELESWESLNGWAAWSPGSGLFHRSGHRNRCHDTQRSWLS